MCNYTPKSKVLKVSVLSTDMDQERIVSSRLVALKVIEGPQRDFVYVGYIYLYLLY